MQFRAKDRVICIDPAADLQHPVHMGEILVVNRVEENESVDLLWVTRSGDDVYYFSDRFVLHDRDVIYKTPKIKETVVKAGEIV